MEKVKITTEYIKLDQLLKYIGIFENGAQAKNVIINGYVELNGEIEKKRGKKIRVGDIITFDNNKYKVI